MKHSEIRTIALQNIDMIMNGYEGPLVGVDTMTDKEFEKFEQYMDMEEKRIREARGL